MDASTAQTVVFGLTSADLLSAGLNFFGIIAAVALTIYVTPKIADKKAARDQREATFRLLLSSMNDAASSEYNQAIAVIPVDFAGFPDVTSARDAYIKVTNRPGQEPQLTQDEFFANRQDIQTKQRELIATIAKSLGYDFITANEIRDMSYISEGYTNKLDLSQKQVNELEGIRRAIEERYR